VLERDGATREDFSIYGLGQWSGGRPVLWTRAGAVAGALGYGISAAFSLASGLRPVADGVNEVITALVAVFAFFLARRRPRLAAGLLLGAVTAELLLAVYLIPEAALTSPIVFPILIVVSGLFLGSRAAIAEASFVGLVYPAALLAAGRHGPWFSGLEPVEWKRLMVTEMVAAVAGLFAWLAIKTFNRVLAEAEERRRLEIRLQHLQRLEVVGQLAGIAAHDFQNILAIVQNSAALLASTKDAEAQELGADLQQTAKSGKEITARLLALARRDEPVRAVIDIAKAVEAIRPLASRLLGPVCRLDLVAEGPAWAVADPSQVEQLVLNLVANARDAMPDGGKAAICVRVLPRAAAAVLGSTGEAPTQVFIEVRDQGSGVAPELQANIFEPFVTTKPRGQGTGLGLATVRSIAVGSGGWVALQSAPGGGASFRVFLPESPAAASSDSGLGSTVALAQCAPTG
jgi:signal transduction histidine kinase